MHLAGEFTVKAPREAVFDALADARFFASCFDGVSGVTETGEARYAAVFVATVAYMTFRFNLTVDLVRVARPDVIEARIAGAPVGIAGRLSATSITRLVGEGGSTRIQYTMDVALTGTLGSLGQPVLKAKARDMEQAFVARLRAAFETAPAEPR